MQTLIILKLCFDPVAEPLTNNHSILILSHKQNTTLL